MINTVTLRKALGWLGMLLPWIVVAGSVIFGYGFPESISATYYISTCVAPFMIILGAAGILLINYNGYDRHDAIICTLAGIFGLFICLFPCESNDYAFVGTFNMPSHISGWIHNISAVIFFGLLAYNSICLFTKSAGEMTEEKKKRNLIYKVCGYGMIGSFILLPLLTLLHVPSAIWIIEMLALTFFGISWLTKSQCYSWLFRDKE